MSDIKASDGDVVISGADFVLATGLEGHIQDIERTLRTWLGESVYNRLAGLPYEQVIFQVGTTPEAARFIIEQRLNARDSVENVEELSTTIDQSTRKLTISGTVATPGGTVEVSL